MRNPRPSLERLLSTARTVAGYGSFKLSIAALLALWLGIAAKDFENRTLDTDIAKRDLQNFVMLAEENVLRSFSEMDKAILYLRRVIEAAGDKPDYHRIASTTDILSTLIVQVAIIDEKGVMRASNVGPQPAPPIDLSDREHFRFHIDRTDDKLFISKPVIGRASKKWSVQLARGFKKPDGSFGGVVVASFNPDHFKRSYGRVDVGKGSTYALIGRDGIVRALSASDEFVRELGQDTKNSPISSLLHEQSDVVAWVSGASRNSARLIVKHLASEHDLIVVASLPQSTVYADSNYQLLVMIGFAFLLSIAIGVVGQRFTREEKARLEKDRELRLTLEHMTQGIMLVTKDLEVPVMNQQCARLLGLPEQILATKPTFDELVEVLRASGTAEANDLPNGRHAFDVLGAKDLGDRFESYERTRADGTVIEVHSAKLDDGGFVRTFSDITQRRQAQLQADKLAAEDALTGLSNRRMLIRALDLLVEKCAGLRDQTATFAVLYIDLDRFKAVNDTQGHAVGDQLLRMVADRLRASLRADDTIARLGGDEFAVLLPLMNNGAATDLVAQRLVDALSRPFDINGLQILIGASIGIALAPRDGRTSSDLLIAADLALYAAKSAGRCTFRYYSLELNEGLKARQEIETELRQAIAKNELELHYQPIVSLKENRLVGFEALARWKHEKLGMVPPDKFIPIAEDCGLIQMLGQWALETACKEAACWAEDLTIAVNLSPLQFADAGLISTITRVLQSTGLAASRLEIEVTEGILMKDTKHVVQTFKLLKEIGVRIAMDDFGTGYSSLAYLQQFDFDRIKVDRCFVSKIEGDPTSKAIVRAVIDIAASRGMHTTAEGIETESQRADLAAMGCDEAQGYLFSRPIAAPSVPSMIERWQAHSRAA